MVLKGRSSPFYSGAGNFDKHRDCATTDEVRLCWWILRHHRPGPDACQVKRAIKLIHSLHTVASAPLERAAMTTVIGMAEESSQTMRTAQEFP